MTDIRAEIEQIRRHMARLGVALPDTQPSLCSDSRFGYELPPSFVWFCENYARHSGFPYQPREIPFGLLSPVGAPSALDRRNQQVRELNADWPRHWVSFWHGADGDFCFSFDQKGHPWVSYWYYNSAFYYEERSPEDAGDLDAVDFADWVGRQVDWSLRQPAAG